MTSIFKSSAVATEDCAYGYPCVGKSSITQRFVNGTFPDAYDTTIEDFHLTQHTFMGKKYALKITDTAGQQEYSLFPRSCVVDIDGYILVYAINDRKSFEILQTIYDKIVDNMGESVPILIVGNKLDLQYTGRVVRQEEAQKVAADWKADFLEISAKENFAKDGNTDVQKIFNRVLRLIEISKGNMPAVEKNSSCKSSLLQVYCGVSKMMAESRNIFVPGADSSSAVMPNATSGATNDANATAAPPGIESNKEVAIPSAKSFANAAELAQAKIESLKKWTVITYKTTKHSINEQLGKASRTVDKDLDERIEGIREIHRQYQNVLKLVSAYTNYFSLANDMLNNEMVLHSESLRNVSQNGAVLFKALNYFTSALETLTDKTIQDTLLTIDHHDQARLEYDVYRCELEGLRSNPNPPASIEDLEEKCNLQKMKYDQLKEDVRVKLTLLEENRAKVLRRQVVLIQKAFSAYFEGNTAALENSTEQLSGLNSGGVKEDSDPMIGNGRQTPSFLEK
uniref:AH domain-containing protein n=1 Tax=Ditylenchus dipsaci TaxID=166011 RepID=A0A915DSG7_9BILA